MKINVGLIAVDRAPLDFMAFPDRDRDTPAQIARKRGAKVLRRLKRNGFKKLCEGQVIVVQARPQILLERQIQRGGRQSSEADLRSGKALKYLEKQAKLMDEIYRAAVKGSSCVRGDGCSVLSCLQRVMRIIHFQEYKPFEFARRLRQFTQR